ncbi:MAG: A/G-specific adenine glycosylase [Chitinophagales bacterium]|jgi:A/G-specific adenine glycosylase|nr:A/G-specific adenine glycosylase [Sphingobacteriales bacterium]
MKLSKSQILSFQKSILEFHQRDCAVKPWKTDHNPYKIWVFEVVMQQTRMEQGLPYYERLIKKFPTLYDLAHAEEDALFAVWKGLGYYSRARNLQFTAKYIVKELSGKFPSSYDDLLKLKGIGEYTAAAIASFAFGQNVAVLDGNVHRVLSRFFGLAKTIQSTTDKRYFQDLVNHLLFKGKSAIFNQAMMDMGSQVCKPQNPNCENCLFSNDCKAFNGDKIADLPPKKVRPVLKERYFYCLFVEYKGKVYLEKRSENDIWKGLYQGIVQEGVKLDLKFWEEKDIDVTNVDWSGWQTQTLSHQKVFMKIGRIKVKENKAYTSQLVKKADLAAIPFPRVVSRFLESTV